MPNSQTFTLNIKAIADMKDVTSNISNIQNALSKLKLPDNLKNSFKTTFEGLNKELNNYQKLLANGIKTKGDSNALTKSGNNILRLYNDIVQKINSIDDSTLRKAFEDIGAGQAAKQTQELRQQLEGLENDLKSKLSNQTFINFDEAKSNLKSFKTELTNLSGDASKAFKTLINSTFNTFTKNIETGRLDLAAQNLAKIKQQVDAIKNDDLTAWYNNLEKGFTNLSNNSGIPGLVSQISNLKNQLIGIEANTLSKLVNDFKQGTLSAGQFQTELTKLITSTNEWGQAQAQTNREIDQVKSRIQYFFGLNNAINLVRRAIRGAFETIKELDAAMTKTAVVTDYTVKDMWNQLPEYTKRANDLGVMTKDAYESATLYFQQGLNADQAAALSTETLKMARIAGLEAAEATDRMTNALRGFNMELNTLSAQHVDDVYSELAAISASDVDEISTAMTKVASLAHSANMEFETTAAFLAQIIETTRESAETAGTALKTVVARFSEVKKLVTEDQLKGTDKDGQVIDVNKVSEALRTAGIDLNKYFIGEVGLDDIFMELASKWDNLTSVQQRYIATQAAGSRQQSRFIALMQDYARTQELVGAAYNAQGASARQFEKTQDSLQSKLARLKNAWNEFLMDITNSSVIKGTVNALTVLLNIINKLTSAFGPAASGFLKFGIAAAGIWAGKKAFSNGGIAEKVLGKIIPTFGNNTAMGAAALNNAATTTATTITSAAHSAATTTTTAAIEAAEILVEGATQAAAIENAGAVEETATEIGGATAEEGVETAGATAEEGVEIAGATAEEEIEIAGAVAEEAIEAKGGLFSKLSNLTPRIGPNGGMTWLGTWGAMPGAAGGAVTGVGVAGFATALLALEVGGIALQDYVASGKANVKHEEKILKEQEKQVDETNDLAAKQKEAYESYLENEQIAKVTTGQEKVEAQEKMAEALATLASIDAKNVTSAGTLNKTYAQENINALEKQAKEEEKALALQRASVALAQREVELGKEYELEQDTTAGSVTQGQWFARTENGSLYESTIHGPGIYDTYEQAELAKNLWNAQQDAAAASLEVQARQEINKFASSLLEGVIKDQGVIDSVAQAYSRGLSIDKLSELPDKDQDSIQSELEDLVALAQDENGKLVLDVINESYEGFIDEAKVQDAFNKLAPAYQKTIIDLLGATSKNIDEILNDRVKLLKNYQVAFRKNVVATLYKNGLTNEQQLDSIVNKLNQSQQQKLIDISNSLGSLGKDFNGKLLEQISQAMLNKEYDQTIETFVTSLTDDPVLTLQKLKSAAEGSNKALKNIVTNLGLINEKGKFDTSKYEIFSRENLVQSFLISESFNDLNKKIAKFREKNSELNAWNIKDLAKESEALSVLLDNNIISANGLSTAINALQEGNITIFDLNENVLQLFNSFDSVADAVSRAGQFIKDFNLGEDWGDAYDFINSAFERMTELVNNRELGNPQLRNYWKAFFEGPLPEDIAGWEEGLALIEQIQGNGGANFWTDLVGFSIDSDGNIADMGLEEFAAQNEFNSYRDYIEDIVESNNEGVNFTDEFYDLMIRNMANHDDGVISDLAAIELDKIVKAYGDGLEGNMPTKQDIQAIVDAYGTEENGLTPQAVLDVWAEKYNNGETVDFSSLEDQIRQSTTSLVEAYDKAFDTSLSNAGMQTGVDTNWLLSRLGADQNGVFSVDTLYAKIGEIVPEVKDGSITAADYIQEQFDKSPDGTITLPVEFDYVTKTTEGWEQKHFKTDISVDSIQNYLKAAEDIQAAVSAESIVTPFNDITTIVTDLNTILSNLGSEINLTSVTDTISNCIKDATELNKILGEEVEKTVTVKATPSTINISGKGGTISFSITTAATGGVVSSFANGSKKLNPGLALTGEEDPEIVWNKEHGYAYLTGKNGPEIQNLQPGDQVFNGKQTKDILKRSGLKSFAKGTIPSASITSYVPRISTAATQVGKKSKGTIWAIDSNNNSNTNASNNNKTSNDWKNELDWLYNLMEDIAELERLQEQLSEKHERYLEDISKTGRDLYNLTNHELNNLLTQRDNYQEALTRRMQEMREQVEASEVSQYAWWNDDDNTIEIDWDAINEITDKDKYDEVTDLISKLEKIQDQMDEAEEALWDIEGQIIELKNRYLEEFIDFQKRVYDAIVDSYQKQIDALEVLNDTINDSDSQILNSLQKEIDLQRQIRDNTETEENIRDLEARLAYLRRDTSGANDAEIRKLEKELEDARKNYTDDLIDQALDRLQESSDEAAEQRQKQIDLLTEQLDYWKEIGAFWPEVVKLIDEGINGEGSLIRGSTLEEILKQADNWKAMSEEQKQVWADDLIKEVNQAGAYLITIAEGLDNLSEGIWALIPESSIPGKHYAAGGLATVTGPAWLDGTPSEPEYVLNARQTDAFLRLADVLPSIFGNNDSIVNNSNGNTYIELNMSVGEIGSDYDVDRLVDRLKDDLYNASAYRNVNAINFLR